MKSTRKNTPEALLALLQQAILLHNQHKLDEADAIYRKVLAQAPVHADALHLRALVCHAKGRFADAARFAEAAIAAVPHVANFQNTAGEAWRRLGRLDLALTYLQQAIRLEPSMAIACLNLSLALGACARHDEALAAALRALERQPAYPEALAQALSLYCMAGDGVNAALLAARLRLAGASGAAGEALGRYHHWLARTHREQHRPDQAASELDAALALYPQFWANWTLRAELSNDALDFSNAELYCTIAANLAPDNEDARLNIGHVLLEQKRLEEAHSHYSAWLESHPDSAGARFALASIHLLRGEFEAGWTHYEARWGLRRHGGGTRHSAAPPWNGGPCARLLLYAEQGLGDTIQMLRFLPQVQGRCAGAVTLQVPAPLLRLARRCLGGQDVALVTEVAPEARFDSACPLMSLPHVLQAHSAQSLGMDAPYIVADDARRRFFDSALAGLQGRKIGLVWQGSAAGLTNRRRPFPLEALAPLRAIPGIELVSLQFGVEGVAIDSHPITDLAAHIADFDDLAAAMMALDAVISVDTGPAHLAGALGVPAYTIVPWLHDWRWGIAGEQSYWYPDMTLIRQAAPNDWAAPVAALIARLLEKPATGPGEAAASCFPAPHQRAIGKNLFPLVHVNGVAGAIVLPLLDPSATRSLLVYGQYMQDQCALIASFLQAGDTVLEVGARHPGMTVGAARAVGAGGRSIAFEPDPDWHRCLGETLQVNQLPWAEARRQAVRRRDGRMKAAGATAGTVEVVALDSLGLEACALIKIEAPAQELEVLHGARGLIGQCRPVLFVARVGPGEMAPLASFMKQRGYRTYRCEAPAYPARNRRNCAENVFGEASSLGLLALPGDGAAPPGAVEL